MTERILVFCCQVLGCVFWAMIAALFLAVSLPFIIFDGERG